MAADIPWLFMLAKTSIDQVSSPVLTFIKVEDYPQLCLPSQQDIQRLHKQPHQEARINCHAFPRSLQELATPKTQGVAGCRLDF